MGSPPRTTTAAADRVRSFGEKTFAAFLDEVSPEAAQALASYLPPVPGFRKTSPSGIQQRKRALAREYISSRLPTSPNRARAELGLYVFWRAWAAEQLGDAEGTYALLDGIEEATPEEKDEDTDFDARQQILDLFTALKALSLDNKCSREKIERLFAFSPFEDSPEIRSLIDGTKPAADIDREIAERGLPQRLRQDEEEIKSLEARLVSLSARMDASTIEVRNLQKDVATLKSRAADLGDSHRELSAALDAHAEAARSAAGLIVSRGRDAGALSKEMNERLAALSAGLDSLARTVEKLSSDASNDEWTVAVDGRLLALEQKETRTDQDQSNKDGAKIGPVDPREATVQIARAERFFISPDEKIRSLASPTDAANILAANLETVGLKKSASQTLAEEICAAALAGQVVFLKGALATEAARLSARTLGARNSLRVSMPIGLNDGEALRAAVTREIASPSESLGTIAVEGVNRSAIDVFADVLSDLAAGDAGLSGSGRDPMLVFASVTQGAASLAIEPRYLELGPIFDLDHLDWRLRRATKIGLAAGSMPVPAFRSIQANLDAKSADSDEPMRLLRKFSPRKNPRIESVVVAAHTSLAFMARSQKVPSPLQSIAFGWLVPFWAALGLTKEEADSELDGGKCDSDTPDPRLRSVLASDDFAPNEAGRR